MILDWMWQSYYLFPKRLRNDRLPVERTRLVKITRRKIPGIHCTFGLLWWLTTSVSFLSATFISVLCNSAWSTMEVVINHKKEKISCNHLGVIYEAKINSKLLLQRFWTCFLCLKSATSQGSGNLYFIILSTDNKTIVSFFWLLVFVSLSHSLERYLQFPCINGCLMYKQFRILIWSRVIVLKR